ncbi:hypothetical protein DFH06DRAFT_1229386 [Mycena polygramma]|nr:hypothetical protein DFH06DRAFT_1229386 [Mycena polygramma]
MFHLTISCLFFISLSVLAAPLDSRTVFDPPIISPSANTVWKAGQVETVTWNASGIPAGSTGQIVLGFLTSDSENLSNTSLASGFDLTDGKVDITVPSVVTRTNYIIVLFGDSGNRSPEFTIQGSSSSSVSAGASSASSGPASASSGPSSNNGAASPPSSPGSVESQTEILSVTPSPPIATASSSAPLSTPTAPSSGPSSSSASLPTSSSPTSSPAGVTAPSPSPSNNAGLSTINLKNYQVLMPAVALLLFI